MKGSPAKMGTIAGTAGHASALKQAKLKNDSPVQDNVGDWEHTGTVQHRKDGSHAGSSTLKQKQKFDETEVKDITTDWSGKGNVYGEGTKTTRYKSKEDGDDYKDVTYSATDYDLYRYPGDARKTSKTKTTHKSADDGSTKKHKTKTVSYSKDASCKITKKVEKRKTKGGITETSEKTKTPSTKFGQWWVGLGMKGQERRAKKYKEKNQ